MGTEVVGYVHTCDRCARTRHWTGEGGFFPEGWFTLVSIGIVPSPGFSDPQAQGRSPLWCDECIKAFRAWLSAP